MLSLSARSALAAIALASLGRAQDPPVIPYELERASDFVSGCFPPCKCPLVLHKDLVGTFGLQFAGATPDGFEHYVLLGIDWRLDGQVSITGNGHYRVGGEFALMHQLELGLAFDGGRVQHFDSGLIPGGAAFPVIEISVNQNQMVCFDQVFDIAAAPSVNSQPFCDASDGSLAACPCGNVGDPDAGCDIAQGTGGVGLTAVDQDTAVPSATLEAAGFPPASTPAALVLRSAALDPGAPVVFGDGLRCVGVPVVRLAGTQASGGVSTHVFGHAAMAGSGTFYYQVWFRNLPASFCDPAAAFNLSNGATLVWP